MGWLSFHDAKTVKEAPESELVLAAFVFSGSGLSGGGGVVRVLVPRLLVKSDKSLALQNFCLHLISS